MYAETTEKSDMYAAIDLGSNSFHLAIGQIVHGELRWLQKTSEKVQLAFGIDENNQLDESTQIKAIECLQRFHKRVGHLEPDKIRIVGTNALRMIKNGTPLLKKIETLFKQQVNIISGREEARLIYLGVSHTNPNDTSAKLVIDIGGGSTEFIIGKKFQPILTESLHMGCVTYNKLFFQNNQLSQENFANAIAATEQEVQHISQPYMQQGWSHCLGSSGSVKSVFRVFQGLGSPKDAVTLEDLQWLIEYLINQKSIETLQVPNLKPERYPIFPSGISILYGVMKQLQIQKLYYSEGALREGLIYDLLGRHLPENVRERTIKAVTERYSVDITQAEKVCKTAVHYFKLLCYAIPEINSSYINELLQVAALLHEAGISISHTQFHKHGAYILTHADLAGFSRQEQAVLGCLVRLHRRKFLLEELEIVPDSSRLAVKYAAIILRMAVLLHNSRCQSTTAIFKNININTALTNLNNISLEIRDSWLQKNPLIHEDLKLEVKLLKKINFNITLNLV